VGKNTGYHTKVPTGYYCRGGRGARGKGGPLEKKFSGKMAEIRQISN